MDRLKNLTASPLSVLVRNELSCLSCSKSSMCWFAVLLANLNPVWYSTTRSARTNFFLAASNHSFVGRTFGYSTLNPAISTSRELFGESATFPPKYKHAILIANRSFLNTECSA